MLSDLPNVHLLGVKDDREARLWANHFESGRSKVLRLGLHSISRLRQDWDRQLYEQAGVNFEERWRGFTLPASNGVELLDSPVPFVHDDSKRGFQIPSNKLPGTWSYVGRQHSTIWPNLHWLQTAPEVHVIDSCFLCLADSVPTKGRLVLHAYATAAAKPMGPPTLRKQWEILK
jgi:hypothetical protein